MVGCPYSSITHIRTLRFCFLSLHPMPLQQRSSKKDDKTTKVDPYPEKTLRITGIELLRSHRAQPSLVEGLLLAREVNLKFAKPSSTPSMDLILELTKFEQKTKWLFPWGAELVNPAHRPPPDAVIPPDVRFCGNARVFADESEFLEKDSITALLSDSKQQWDAVFMRSYEPSHFALLHLHPCEEVVLGFRSTYISPTDMENIAKCTNLRNLKLGDNFIDFRSVKAIQSLPCLQTIPNLSSNHLTGPLFKFLGAQRNITLLITKRTHVFCKADIFASASLINARSQSLFHVEVDCALPMSIAHALNRCTSLRSISFSDCHAMNDESLRTIFSSPTVQKSVQSIRITCSVPINARTFSVMSRCKNLRWINLACTGDRSYTFSPIIRLNAHHLYSLILRGCEPVDDSILEAIACCRCLLSVELNSTAVSGKAAQAYIRAKRPNWEVIAYDAGLARIED